MNVRRRKVLREISSTGRTILVVAAIAVGLAGLSTTLRARATFTANLDLALTEAVQSSATILTGPVGGPVDDTVVADIEALEGVEVVDGRQVAFGRIDIDGQRRTLRLLVVEDLSTLTVDRLRSQDGPFPPPDGTLALERSSLAALDVDLGSGVTVTDPQGGEHRLTVAASLHDPSVVSGLLVDQVVYGYVSRDTWAGLGQPVGISEITLRVTGDGLDREYIAAVAAQAEQIVLDAGGRVEGIRIPPPGRHVLDNVIASLLLILGSLGAMSLLLSGFLVFNTMAALLARQRPQIGVMKAIGASRRDVLVVYLGTVSAYSILALVLAVPAGALAARLLTRQLGALLNIDIVGHPVPAWVWTVELALGLLVPILAALGPVRSGTLATVAEAIRGQDSAGFGTSRLDRLLARLQHLPTSVRYALRNSVREKVRLSLTLAALSIGGSILVTVLTLQSSLLATVDAVEDYWQQDSTVDLQRPVSLADVERIAGGVDGVEAVEGWLIAPAFVTDADGGAAPEETTVFGVAPDTRFIDPTLLDGRWLRTGDTAVAVINVDVAANEPDLVIGDSLTLRVQGRPVEAELVGLVTSQIVTAGTPRPDAPIIYLPRDLLHDVTPRPGLANRVTLAGAATTMDGTAQQALAEDVEAALAAAGIEVRAVETRTRTRAQVEMLTLPILALLAAMALLFAIVGGLGLLGTMSLSVLERTREIGLVRAVGAGGPTVLGIVLAEGLVVGLASWLIGSLLAVPFGWVMAQAVGISFIKVPLDFRFAPLGVALWFGLAVVLAIVASVVPARAAARISVREAVAYE